MSCDDVKINKTFYVKNVSRYKILLEEGANDLEKLLWNSLIKRGRLRGREREENGCADLLHRVGF